MQVVRELRTHIRAAFLMCLLCAWLGNALVAQTSTTTQLTIMANGLPVTDVPAGTVVTLTATVQSRGAAVNPGLVKFCDASAPFCTDFHIVGSAQLVAAGTAQIKFRPGIGSHQYKAVFVGTKARGASTSAIVDITVPAPLIYPTETEIGASGGPGSYGLVAAVSGTASVAPTGSASFLDTTNDNYVLATGTLEGPSPGLDFTVIDTTVAQAGVFAYVAADFNNDGILDIAYNVNVSARLEQAAPGFGQILLGNGDGSFRHGVTYPTGLCPLGLYTADFNSDGIADLVFTDSEYCSVGQQTQTSDLTVLLGNGDGTFSQSYQTLLGISADNIAIGDFNGDGIADIAVLTESDFAFAGSLQSLIILLGKGDGTFEAAADPYFIGSVEGTVVTADFNSDGIADLAISTGGGVIVPQPAGVYVLLGKGDGTFSAGAPILLSGDFLDYGLGVADFNNDGCPDLVTDIEATESSSNAIQVLLGNGDGTFQTTGPASNPTAGFGYTQSNAFDLNGDGNADLLAFGSNSDSDFLLLGDGKGGFAVATAPLPDATYSFAGALVYDFNGDGVPDIFTGDYGGDSFDLFITRYYNEETTSVDGISPVGTGTHYIEATYPGDTIYEPSLSVLYPLTAEPAPTQLTLTANPSSSAAGKPVLLTATVTPGVAQNHVATGTVTFSCNGELIGTGILANGVATFSTTALAAGTDHLLAQYAGDTNFAPSSGTAIENVTGTGGCAAFTIALSPSTLRLRVALSGSVIVLLKSIDTFSGPLTLTYGAIPAYGSATLTPATVTLTAGGSSSATLSLKTALVAANAVRGLPGSSTILLATATILLICMRQRPNRSLKLLGLGSAFFLLQAIGGCGHNVTSTQFIPPGTYQIPVTATDVDGNSQTANLTLVVTP